MNHYINLISKFFLALFLFISVYSSVLTIYNGSENSSLLRVFSDDESSQVERLQDMILDESLDAGGFKGGFYHYGQAYNTLAYSIISILDLVGFNKFDYQISVLILKLISLTGYILSILLLYLILRSIGVSESISSIFSLIFGVHTDYWGWATTIHPDTLQMCFILFSFFLIIKIKSINFAILLSSFFIGLSFGTKYFGLFLVIFLASFVVISQIQRVLANERDNVNYFINITSWSILSFFSGWIVLNPHILFRINKFIEDLSFQRENLTNFGGGKALNNRWTEWVSMYYDEYGLIVIFMIFGLLYLISYFIKALFNSKKNLLKSIVLLERKSVAIISIIIYVLISSLYLFVEVKYREWRYSYHLLPFIIIISGYGFYLLMALIDKNYISIIVFLMASSLIVNKGIVNFELLAKTHYAESGNTYVKAGNWLKGNFHSNNIVLAGTYSYVDDEYFTNVAYTYDLNPLAVETFSPDIIFMNDSVPGRYVWKKPGTNLSDHDFIYKKKWKDQSMIEDYGLFLKEISSKKSSWKVVYETDNEVIFVRK
jgi:hypothetical protein